MALNVNSFVLTRDEPTKTVQVAILTSAAPSLTGWIRRGSTYYLAADVSLVDATVEGNQLTATLRVDMLDENVDDFLVTLR